MATDSLLSDPVPFLFQLLRDYLGAQTWVFPGYSRLRILHKKSTGRKHRKDKKKEDELTKKAEQIRLILTFSNFNF